MLNMNSNANLFLKLAFIVCGFLLSIVVWSDSADIPKKAQPNWILPVKLPEINEIPKEQIRNGVYYLLVDNQVMVSKKHAPQYYHHNADYIVNKIGVERNSQINIHYDPNYQTLSLHSLHVIRDGKVFDKIKTARMKLIQVEEDMDELIYNGRTTLNIILDDIRVGDVIEYSYSRYGMNPVYQNIFAYHHYLNWTVPVGRLSLRILWNKAQPLQYKIENSKLELTFKKTSGGREYVIRGDKIEPVKIDNNTPSWFSPWGAVRFSELESWEDVARWSEPLYQDVIIIDDDVKEIIANIKAENTNIESQISAALRFVQDKIRYLGIEIGQNSHRPNLASDTLRNRYGDCKDKTVLLLALLKGLELESYPALVNTEEKLNGMLPNIHAFDHVIAYIEHEDKRYWLDPTRSYQYGDIDTIHQPDYGHALVLRAGTRDLSLMETTRPKSGAIVKDKFTLSVNDSVLFSSEYKSRGWNAERLRQRLETKGRDQIQQDYLEFFKGYYPKAQLNKPIEYKDNTRENILTSTEQYLISDFWEKNDTKGRYKAGFYANVISSSLNIPKELKRSHPLHLSHPNRLKQVIEISFDEDDWSFDNENLVEDNDFFYFSSDVEFKKSERKLILSYAYQSKVDHITPERYQEYTAALNKVKNHHSYSIYKDYPSNSATENEQEGDDFQILSYLKPIHLIILYVSLYFVVILLWIIDRKRATDDQGTLFFPVSVLKLIIMWVFTFGLYGVYWFYKNFHYIKKQENNASMPMARGFFYSFWYYSLWNKLKEDSDRRFAHSHLPNKFAAVCLALVFLAAAFLSNVDGFWVPSLFLSAVLVLPMSNYIQFINGIESPALAKNSKWRFRHFLLILLSVPLLALSIGSETHLLPSDSVVRGSQVLAYDIKTMQRRGVISPSDKIDYFYSDAFLFIGDDGNGFTQRHVFSYWKDDDNAFVQQQAEYSEIEDILVNWGSGFGENSTVTIVKKDGSKFLLFISNTDRKDKLFVKSLKKRWNDWKEASS